MKWSNFSSNLCSHQLFYEVSTFLLLLLPAPVSEAEVRCWAFCPRFQQFKGWVNTKAQHRMGPWVFVLMLGPTICVHVQRPPCHHDPNNGNRVPLHSCCKTKRDWFLF